MNNIITAPNGLQLTRFMEAFACPAANNRNAGCDYVCNNAIMPWQITENLASTDRHQINYRVSAPHKPNLVYPDNIILFDATELPPDFDRQYVVSFELDSHSASANYKGTFSDPKKPTYRYRGVKDYSANPNLGDNYPIDPGPNADSGASNARGNIRWRHGRNDSANFLFADGSVRNMGKTKGYGTPGVSGDVLRKFFRPKPPPNYVMLDL
jgi:prepilin-type processing-associated H-X9-DG protein